MVIFKVQRTCNPGLENAVVVNSDIQELRPYKEIQVTKSNSVQHRFRLIMNSTVKMGYILINEKESKQHRLHLSHKYHVEGVESSLLKKKEPPIDFTKLELAACTSAIETIVEKVFRPRVSALRKQIGVQLIRGVILYGPPGTGKTSTILALCNYFRLQPTVISGPELVDSLVGGSERAIRELFKDAINDQTNKGDSSPLHVIIFDEMDALFSKRTLRGDGGSETRNGIVTQLLTMLDGTTNRLDMIEPAFLRAGRFDLRIKIDLPNIHERMAIMNYHLRTVRKHGYLSSDVSSANIHQLSVVTHKYNAADITGIVNEAISKALTRTSIDTLTTLKELKEDKSLFCVEWNDLIGAFHEVERMRKMEAQLETEENQYTINHHL